MPSLCVQLPEKNGDDNGKVRGVIDLRRLTEDDAYRDGALRKGADPETIGRLIGLAPLLRDAEVARDEIRAEANTANKAIGKAAPDERDDKIAAAGALKGRLTEAEATFDAIQSQIDEVILHIPNPAHESVPDGNEDASVVLSESGTPGTAPPLDHADFAERMGFIETDHAVQMSGSRFAYLMGDAVRLELALVQYALATVSKHGFTPVIPPVLVRNEQMEKAGFFPTDRSTVYELPADDMSLVGTSEVALAGLHRGDRLSDDQLPLRYAGFSSCFRREAGTYGKDTRGIFRVHQFDKVEMFSYALPETSWDEFDAIQAIEEEIVTGLELPYRVINIPTGDLGAAAAKKHDIEVWLPSEGRYREITSCSNYLEFSARRLDTRTKGSGPDSPGSRLVHTLNGTACAISRTLVYMFENHQQPDGSFVVPAALRPFCGLEVLTPPAG